MQREAGTVDDVSTESDDDEPPAKPAVQDGVKEEANRVRREAETQPPDRRKSRQPPSTGVNPDRTRRKR